MGNRLAFPLMCLAVAFVAAPVGVRSKRSGRSYTFATGLLILGGYFVLRKMVQPSAVPSVQTALLAAQVPNLVLCAIGLGLLWRVDRV